MSTTPADRYDLAESTLLEIRGMAESMQTIGCYGAEEETAFRVLLLSLVRAMGILDPEAARKLVTEQVRAYAEATLPERAKATEPAEGLGQYL